MPELPEVETVRLGLIPVVNNKTIVDFEQRRLDLRWPLPENMPGRLKGLKVVNIDRRSKYLLLELNSGETLIIHLGMSGRLLLLKDGDKAFSNTANLRFRTHKSEKHDHIVIYIKGGSRLVYNDPRRFGAMDLFETNRIKEHKWLVNLGPEPMSNQFSPEFLINKLKRRKSSIKSALMDQKVIAGLGNIYVSESLWEAGISPKRNTRNISKVKIDELVFSIRKVLREAIALGGTSLKDFRTVGGDLGYFQNRLKVYGRIGEECVKSDCFGQIQTIKQSGRVSYYCNSCQS